MNVSKVQIVNMALGRIGVSRFVSAITESSIEAQVARLHWDLARDRTLEAIPWSFARRRAALALSDTDPPDEWAYRYTYPIDCVRAIGIESGLQRPAADETVKYVIESDNEDDPHRKHIFTDQEEAVLIYTARIEAVTAYPALFVEALTWALAADCAMPLTQDVKLRQYCQYEYAQALRNAAAAAMTEDEPATEPDASWIRARL